MRNRYTLPYALRVALVAAAALLVAVLVALGCRPSAPAGQDDATATPEPTATSEPTETTTPSGTATPTPSLHPRMSRLLKDRFAKHQETRRSGATGQSDEMALVSLWTSHVDEVLAFLASHDITPPATVNGRPASEIPGDIIAEVPVSLFPELSRQRIGTIEHANPYHPLFSQGINTTLAKYQAGLLPEDAEFLWLDISPSEGEAFNSLKRFLESNGVLLANVYDDSFEAFVPISLLERLALRPEPTRVEFNGGPFASELIEQIRERMRQEGSSRSPTTAPTADPSLTAESATGAATNASPQQQVVRSPALTAHSAAAWHDNNPAITGAGVKIGIIDVGFSGWD